MIPLLFFGGYGLGYLICMCGYIFCAILDDEDLGEVLGPIATVSLLWPIAIPVGLTIVAAHFFRGLNDTSNH